MQISRASYAQRVMRTFVLCCTLLLLGSSLNAQAQFNVPEEAFFVDLSASVDILEDPSHSLELGDLLSPSFVNRFRVSHQQVLHAELDLYSLWLRVHLQSPKRYSLSFLSLENAHLKEIDIYSQQNGQWQVSKTGTARPFENRPSLGKYFTFPIIIEPKQDKFIYLRIRDDSPQAFSLTLASSDEVILRDGLQHGLQGFSLGLLSMAAALCLFVFVYFSERSFFYLFILAALNIILQVSQQGQIAHWLPQLYTAQEFICNLSLLLLACCALHLLRRYYSLHSKAPRLDKALRFSSVIGLSLAALSWTLSTALMEVLSVSVVALTLSLTLGLALYFLPKQSFIAKLQLLSLVPILLATIVYLSFKFQAIESGAINSQWLGINIASLFIVMQIWAFSLRGLRLRRGEYRSSMRIYAREHSTKAKAKLLSQLSQLLRGPMNGILGMSELLLEAKLSDKQRAYTQSIAHSGNALLNHLNELQDISELENGTLHTQQLPFELRALLQSCIRQNHVSSQSQGINLRSRIAEQLPTSLYSDPIRLKQVLTALIEFSIENSHRGEIVLSATLCGDAEQQHIIEFAIEDEASRLGEKEKNFLLNGTLAEQLMHMKNAEAIPLNLIAARHIINQMGGTLRIDSTQSGGNRYSFTLSGPDGQLSPTDQFDFNRFRALIIDEDEACRRVLLQQCAATGLQVDEAENGLVALAALRTRANLNKPFDLIVIEENMPSMSGIELAARIKADKQLSSGLKIIMLSGESNNATLEQANNLGISKVLTKPIASYTLRSSLHDELSGDAKEDFRELIAQQ